MKTLREELNQKTTEELKELTKELQEKVNSLNEELSSEERHAMVKKHNLASRIIRERAEVQPKHFDLGEY